MSNARYFADGVDFWRVIYDDDTTEGPYISPVSANKVGKYNIRIRQTWSYGRVTSYRLQKLGIIKNDCKLELDGCPPGLCFGGHGHRLDWEDWSA